MVWKHLIVEGFQREELVPSNLEKIINHLTKLIDMDLLTTPQIVRGKPYNPGYTAFAIIDYSHISIHTFEKVNYAAVDIFSCKDFNEKPVLEYLSSYLINLSLIHI